MIRIAFSNWKSLLSKKMPGQQIEKSAEKAATEIIKMQAHKATLLRLS